MEKKTIEYQIETDGVEQIGTGQNRLEQSTTEQSRIS